VAHPARRVEPEHLRGKTNRDRTGIEQALGESREQRLERVAATGQEHMEVLALGHTRAGLRTIRKGVTLDDRDSLEVTGE
jgi:hypothetical protein